MIDYEQITNIGQHFNTLILKNLGENNYANKIMDFDRNGEFI